MIKIVYYFSTNSRVKGNLEKLQARRPIGKDNLIPPQISVSERIFTRLLQNKDNERVKFTKLIAFHFKDQLSF